ncbi:MAG: hypothetical protein GXO58_02490 [Thermodesulfobacteria bacterium]|nr:hypothetical protein [Thermodesulfobacteriota bacterium]
MISPIPRRENVGIILNPLGGGNRAKASAVKRGLEELGEVIEASTPGEILKALCDFSASSKGWLIISGGDGTVQMVLTALFQKRPYFYLPRLAILPGGTTNLIAMDVGPRGSQERAISRLKREYFKEGSGRVVLERRHVIRLRSEASDIRYGMFIGGGLVSQGVRFFEKSFRKKERQGAIGIAATILIYLKNFLSGRFEASDTRVRVDGGEPVSGKASVILISSLERLFGKIRPFWAKGAGPLQMSILFSRPKGVIWLLPWILSGKGHRLMSVERGYFSCRFWHAHIQTTSALALDGEIIGQEGVVTDFIIENGGEVSFWKW